MLQQDALKKYCDSNQQIEVKPIDRILTGIEFCVLSTAKDLPSVEELTVLLKLHNASITAFPRINKTFAIIAGDLTSRNVLNYTRKVREEENQNVLKAEWVVNNLLPNEPLDEVPKIVPRDFLFMKANMKRRFEGKFDEFGDSYFEVFKTDEDLKTFIESMKKVETTDEEMRNFQEELEDDNFNFFRGLTGNFIYSDSKLSSIKVAEQMFKIRGGVVDKEAEIIFVDKRFYKKEVGKNVTSHQWIIDSNKAGKKMSLEGYEI